MAGSYRSAIRFIAVLAALMPACLGTGLGSLRAEHVKPHERGVKSASFARICRPNAYATCLRASVRGVKGFSAPFCARRQTACRSCLEKLMQCIRKIGHAKRSEFSCDECSGKFSRCIGKRYPKLID